MTRLKRQNMEGDVSDPSNLFDAKAFSALVRIKLDRDGTTYREAARAVPTSSATLNRIARWLAGGGA